MQIQAKKSLGQHFLRDQGIARKIVDLVNPREEDVILEIGPGTGILTQFLIERFGSRLHVVEIDRESVAYLRKHYTALEDRIYEEDFLQMDLTARFGHSICIVGNFPYNISTQILFKVFAAHDSVYQVVGMFQREVARRICMDPGSKEYGILSVLLAAYYERSYCFTVPEQVFSPPPKVKSGVIDLTMKLDQPQELNHALLHRVVKLAFNQRRKTLRNSLKSVWVDVIPDIPLMQKRPEQLGLEEFVELVTLIESQSS